jgi:hypothetical protein
MVCGGATCAALAHTAALDDRAASHPSTHTRPGRSRRAGRRGRAAVCRAAPRRGPGPGLQLVQVLVGAAAGGGGMMGLFVQVGLRQARIAATACGRMLLMDPHAPTPPPKTQVPGRDARVAQARPPQRDSAAGAEPGGVAAAGGRLERARGAPRPAWAEGASNDQHRRQRSLHPPPSAQRRGLLRQRRLPTRAAPHALAPSGPFAGRVPAPPGAAERGPHPRRRHPHVQARRAGMGWAHFRVANRARACAGMLPASICSSIQGTYASRTHPFSHPPLPTPNLYTPATTGGLSTARGRVSPSPRSQTPRPTPRPAPVAAPASSATPAASCSGCCGCGARRGRPRRPRRPPPSRRACRRRC